MPNAEKIIEAETVDGESLNELERKSLEDQDKRSAVLTYLISMTSFLFLITCVFSINKVPSTSMEPTIAPKSFIINWRIPFLFGDPIPDYGEIVVFKSAGGDHRYLVKRVIGLPGDQISFAGGYVLRNGERLAEPYLQTEGETYSEAERYSVPDGCIFVLGDNRLSSKDSRFMENPFIPVESITAKELVSFPINPIKWFQSSRG